MLKAYMTFIRLKIKTQNYIILNIFLKTDYGWDIFTLYLALSSVLGCKFQDYYSNLNVSKWEE